MKNVIIILMIGFLFVSCKWEYKIISVKGEEQKTSGKLKTNDFEISDKTLNLLGKDGWELVGIYEKIETVHPNFGDDRYVSGLQPNVRTSEINFVFKRKKLGSP